MEQAWLRLTESPQAPVLSNPPCDSFGRSKGFLERFSSSPNYHVGDIILPLQLEVLSMTSAFLQ
jgi:hypothetical protein